MEVRRRRQGSNNHATSTVSQGYFGDWSEELFEIALRLLSVQVTYELRDLEVIKGKFYES